MAFWRRRRDEPKEPEPAVPAEPAELDAPAELEAPAPDPVPDKAVREGTFEIEGSDEAAAEPEPAPDGSFEIEASTAAEGLREAPLLLAGRA